ncbi:MAG: SufS family cysteine desulfurase [Cellvibrionaceae bacterium]|jgi:SufS family cysteine desulfurase
MKDKNFDPVQFKKQFPLFDHKENQALVYLDNAATTQKPQCVINAISGFYSHINANANRSSHRLGRAATIVIQEARKKAAQFINATSAEEIVFTSGATEGLNIIANGLAKKLKVGDEVMLSIAEHHANIVPWQEAVKISNANLHFIRADFSDLNVSISDKTKVISITAASNTLGSVTDLSYIRAIKKEYPNLTVVVDASQLAAHRIIDVKGIECDFLVFSAHKIYGPSGVGVLYGKKEALDDLSPLLFGGEMIVRVDKQDSTYAQGPERFEAGTSPLSAIAGLSACFDFWSVQNRPAMKSYEEQVTEYLYKQLEKLCAHHPRLKLIGEAKNNIGIAIIASDEYSVTDIAFWLDEKDFAVRVGDHCAQPLWQSMGLNKVLRLSLAAYNTFGDIDKLIDALNSFIATFSGDKNSQCCKIQKDSVDIQQLISLRTWQKKYKQIMKWGKGYQPKYDIRKSENLIAGCETDLWLFSIKENNRWVFLIDSDSSIVRGLALLVVVKADNKSDEEIKSINFYEYLTLLGLDKYLSSSRVSGLFGLIEKIRKITNS